MSTNAKTCAKGHSYRPCDMVGPGSEGCPVCRRKRNSRSKWGRTPAHERQKILARNAVYAAVKSGRLLKLPCSVCGDPVAEAHHEDYEKRFDVIWLCHAHHLEIHGATP